MEDVESRTGDFNEKLSHKDRNNDYRLCHGNTEFTEFDLKKKSNKKARIAIKELATETQNARSMI